MIRLGLCCIFYNEPIRFRRTTAKHLGGLTRAEQLDKLSNICVQNAESVFAALSFCRENGIGCFRVNSQILPLKTHPDAGYGLSDLPGGPQIRQIFLNCGEFARNHDIRVTFHPDQFILLSSPNKEVTRKSIEELVYQAEVAEWIGGDVINIHAGGVYGDKKQALKRLIYEIERLPPRIRSKLTLENDDRSYSPADLIPVCKATGTPLVYDVHHHRCLPDGLAIEEASEAALTTWRREPLFHLSSPLEGFNGRNIRIHHNYIDPADFPECWRDLDITVEVEAKAKELAVLHLQRELREKRGVEFRPVS